MDEPDAKIVEQPAAGPELPPEEAARGKGGGVLLPALALALAALALILALYLVVQSADGQRRMTQEHAENLARDQRGSDSDRRLGELERQWAQAQAEEDVSAVRITEAQLRRRREALAMLDIERAVEQAQLQLRLGGAVGGAIDALSAIDAHLGRLGSANALRVQAALRHDLARLKQVPDVDRGALATRLDALLTAVDSWHPSADAAHPAARAAIVAVPATASQRPESAFARVRAWLSQEFGDFLRIREIDTPEALLLGPAQQQLLRDRFRLGVLDLRQAILARDERAIRAEEGALETLLQRFFDPNQPGVSAAIAQLRAAATAAIPAASPSLDETLAALHAVRGTQVGPGS